MKKDNVICKACGSVKYPNIIICDDCWHIICTTSSCYHFTITIETAYRLVHIADELDAYKASMPTYATDVVNKCRKLIEESEKIEIRE